MLCGELCNDEKMSDNQCTTFYFFGPSPKPPKTHHRQELLADTTFRPRTNADATSRMAVSKLKVVSDPGNYFATVEVSESVERPVRANPRRFQRSVSK